ncbi:hypothetical protein CH92_17725 [Stutzerimonas stutzeri]|uniref:Uncharacterized protein n=1 Tax=Stutzerimonas stutzeri TaxID=316 RepID=W8R425_STUST|nr:hypothetical protein [Stutzerimonas stutzeri]AHL77680.1 hypothetical protein CH92_17725 [Stutzerimonas stutzeri]MCQ4331006.1 hypothetical protein [Stutzerimonas stutzeri]
MMKRLNGVVQGIVVFMGALALLMLMTYLLNRDKSVLSQLLSAPMMLEMSIMTALICVLVWTAHRRH